MIKVAEETGMRPMGRSEQLTRIAIAAVLIGFSSQEKTTVIMALTGYLVGAALLLTALARNARPWQLWR
jgi:hypothetical protein